jgi:hypothetical protein
MAFIETDFGGARGGKGEGVGRRVVGWLVVDWSGFPFGKAEDCSGGNPSDAGEMYLGCCCMVEGAC